MASEPLVIDIAKAVAQLEANPELAAKMNELAFGEFAASQIAELQATVSTQAGEIADLKDERNALAKACGDAMGRWQEAESQLDNGSGGLFGRDQLLAFKRGFDIMAEISMKLGHPKKLVRAVEKLQKRAEKAEAENARLVEALDLIEIDLTAGSMSASTRVKLAVSRLKDKPHG